MKECNRKAFLLGILLCILTLPLPSKAFDLIEFDVNLTLNDPIVSFDYSNLYLNNTGFTLANPNQTLLNINSAFLPQLGLIPGEGLQQGFVVYDGTLFLEVEAADPQTPRMDIRTTYRMDVDSRFLRRNEIRDLYIRQGRMDPARARARARSARLADTRVMRFVEGENGGRWIRAVRAIDARARADVRFMPRNAPDGILGHYGYDTRTDGTNYVWAVVDKNSRYTVGLNVDDDNDGIFNANDNCRDLANPNQFDIDSDGLGDQCDDDDDNDSITDELDNCPLAANQDQVDTDGDEIGDACDQDDDNDQVNDGLDSCPGTQSESIVNDQGCSVDDLCPCSNDNGWNNHGAYVRCIASTTTDFVKSNLLTDAQRNAIVSTGAQSDCGHKK